MFATQHYIKQPLLARLSSSSALLDTDDSVPEDCWDQDKRQQRMSHCKSSTSIDRLRCLERCCISPPCNTSHFVSTRFYGSDMRYAYLNGTRTGTCASNELAGAGVVRIHAKSATGTRTACLGHAALDVSRVTRAIAGQVEALSSAT